ncbi:MAG: hypothetical protein AABX11_07035 [Nanoarchaeota archaeon]
MRNNIWFFVLGVLILTSGVWGLTSSFSYVNQQTVSPSFSTYYGSNVGTYWPILNNASDCRARQDLLLQVFPAACQPAVVRSDLLEEQNVPVFCQLSVLKINPLIDIKEIRSLSFSGNYPKEVSGVAFHPAQAAFRTNDVLLGNPVTTNIGYTVVVLKKQTNESSMPESLEVKLQANVHYNSGNVLGVGRSEFMLNEQSDEEWDQNKFKQSFWSGKFFVRVEEINSQSARISLYHGDVKFNSVTVPYGKFSDTIYLPGSYCQAGLKVEFAGLKDMGSKKATIEMSNSKGVDVFDVYEGSKFMNDRCIVEKILIDSNNSNSGSVLVSCPGSKVNLFLKSVANDASAIQDAVLGAEAESNFTEAISNYKKVASLYPAEKSETSETIYGEEALKQAIDLAESLGKQKSAFELYKLFVDTYPKSAQARIYEKTLNSSYYLDSTKSSSVVKLDNEYRNVRLVSLSEPKEKTTGEFAYGNNNLEIALNSKYEISPASADGKIPQKYIQVTSIDENRVTISSNCDELGKLGFGSNTLAIGESRKLCGQPLVFKKANLKKSAVIKLIPEAYNTETKTNVTIKIGIEKRAIKFSPDKTKDMIKNLNDSIKSWDSISNRLGTVVTGLKTACVATAAVLTFKNLITGLSGSSLARQQVMPFWKSKCQDEIDNFGGSMDKCYSHYSSDIDASVSSRTAIIEKVNRDITKIQGTGASILNDKSVDVQKSRVELAKLINSSYGSDMIELPDGKTVMINGVPRGEFTVGEFLSDSAVQSGTVSYREMTDLYANLESKSKGGAYSSYWDKELSKQADRISVSLEASYHDSINAQAVANNLPAIPTLDSYGKTIVTDVKPIDDKNRNALYNKDIVLGDQSKFITYIPVTGTSGKGGNNLATGTYLAELEQNSAGGGYRVKNARMVSNFVDGVPTQSGDYLSSEELKSFPIVTAKDSISYQTALKSPEVRYYETEPYKGMPALVPIDINNGWYAATRPTLPALGGIGAFDASGRVTSFWVCNAGKNGRAEFDSGMGDDTCRQFNTNTGQSLEDFPGLSPAQTRNYVNKAIQAIQEASRQSTSLGSTVSVLGSNIKKGKPMVNSAEADCYSFMSPTECNLLFNLCDPVICPNSRCDLGGQYPVSDVVQSGIVGSIFLCLPNFPEVKIPVCLTGIKAGIDSYVGILKAHRDCLTESLNSGQVVGTCDLIYSIYTCDFFWQQLSPIAKLLLPALLAKMSGQGARGGAEYLTVSAAFQNTQKSIDYLTNVYAVNAFKAFQVRSIEEAGTEICKSFISSSLPSQIKSFVQPDSPPQFHGYFSSIKYTDATVPATYQYKVFYYVFAGNDAGVSYRVYLKGNLQSSYYSSTPYVQVATGFIPKGEKVSITKDFTAPEGYTELCINVNGEESCGFKQVSTSFAVNYVTDSVAANEIEKQGISSEKDCISGSANSMALLNPNLQAGAQEALNSDVYRRGIIRVCSTGNPASSTDPTRYVNVGNCGDAKIGCWLDKNSVTNAVTDNNKGVINSTLSNLKDLQANQTANLQKDLGVYSSSDGSIVLDNFRGEVEKIVDDGVAGKDVVARASKANVQSSDIESKLFYNIHKAELIQLRGRIFDVVARYLYSKPVAQSNAVATSGTASVGGSSEAINGKWKFINGASNEGRFSDIYIATFGAGCDNIKWSLNGNDGWVGLDKKIKGYSILPSISEKIINAVSNRGSDCSSSDLGAFLLANNFVDVNSGGSAVSSSSTSGNSGIVMGGFDMLRLWRISDGASSGSANKDVFVGYFNNIDAGCQLGWSLEQNTNYVTLEKSSTGYSLNAVVLEKLNGVNSQVVGFTSECTIDNNINIIENNMNELGFEQISIDGSSQVSYKLEY